MKSIGTRLAMWYAAVATGTLACLFLAGYYLLQSYLINGLDLLNQTQFEQIKAHLGRDYKSLSPAIIDQRIRETTEYASVLFYIDIHSAGTGTIFYSSNLHGRSIPDIPGKRKYDIGWDGTGGLRVGEFILDPFDVIIATPQAQVKKVMEGYSEVCASLLAVMLAISVAIGIGLSRLALRPVRLIRETANRIRSDNLSERIPVSEVKDEMSDLARLLNQMFDRLELSFEQIRRFTADASHELKTPLSLMRLHAEKLLADGSLKAAHEEEVLTLLEELTRLNKIIDELLFLSRAEARSITLELNPHDPAPFLQNFSQDARALAEHHGLAFSYTHEGSGVALCEPRWLRRVLLNLVANAVNASPPAGCVTLRSVLTADVWRVAIEDEGAGVPAVERERIFDRFVRLHSSVEGEVQGSGLGLAICRSIVVDLHRGRIFASAGTNGRGLRVVFEVPAHTERGKPLSELSHSREIASTAHVH